MDRIWDRWERALLTLLAVPLLIALAALAYRSTLYMFLGYNEGWNAFHAAAAMSGGLLYPPPSALITNNYPPLSFFLVGSVANLVGDAVFAGRLVSWAAFLSVASLIAIILQRLGNDRLAAFLAAMLFLAYSVVHFSTYVGMDDPQWLAHSIMMLGLFVYVREPATERGATLAGVLMAAALFVKHNIIALPLTLLLWLVIHDRRSSLRFAAAGLSTGVAGLVTCGVLFGTNFFLALLAPRSYSANEMLHAGLVHLSQMQIPLAVGILGVLAARNRWLTLFSCYLAVSLIIGIVQLSGAGVGPNAMFEALIALSLCLGHLVGQSSARPFRLWTIVACAGSLLLAIVFEGNRRIYLVVPWIEDQKAKQVATFEALKVLAQPGRAVCDSLVYCYWAGKDFELDPFNYDQGVRAGIKDAAAMHQLLEAGAYAVVQVRLDRNPSSIPQNAREILFQNYRSASLSIQDPSVGTLFVHYPVVSCKTFTCAPR